MATVISLDPEPWQMNIRSMKEAITHLYINSDFYDVEIIVGKRSFKCHSLVLGARSSVFEQMFLSNSGNKKHSKPIVVGNVTEKGFEILHRFIYTNEVGTTDNNHILEAFYAAECYGVVGLQNKCTQIISTWKLTTDNVCDFLNKVFDIPSQCQRCYSFLKNNAQVLASNHFLWTQPAVLNGMLEAGCFDGVSPMTVIENVIRWALNQFTEENYKKDSTLLRDALLEPSTLLLGKLGVEKLNAADLTKIISKYPKLLTSVEQAQFFINMNAPGIQPLPEWCKMN